MTLLCRPRRGRPSVVLLLAALLAGAVALAAPAAGTRVTPGSFTGYGFDQCNAPSQKAMDTWLTTSPYWAVGIYIAGDNRYCEEQRNLTREWVRTQLRNGWRLLPITVGPQASCATRYDDLIDPDSARRYAAARAQGRAEARSTVHRARALGISARSTLWYDLEAFDIGKDRCRESALSFLSAWTTKLHDLGYVSGVYSSAASGIRAIDDARRYRPGAYTLPDRLWVAEWVDPSAYRTPPTATPPRLSSSYYDAGGWSNRVLRQYRGDHRETYGGVTINIDTNFLHLGRGSVAPRAPRTCGVRVDFDRYRSLGVGNRGAQVKALQCLLRAKEAYRGELRFRFTHRTERAVAAYQRARSLPVSGSATRRTWTALLAQGRTPVVKIGSARHAVRRLQRSLNARTDAGLPVTGVFDPATTRAVRAYQADRGLRRTGVVAADTWAALQRGLG